MNDRLIKVPAGTRPTKCSGYLQEGGSCAQQIYWVREVVRGGMRAIPVDCSGPDGQTPSEAADDSQLDLLSGQTVVRDGFGYSHAGVCPDRMRIAANREARTA